MIDRFEPEVHAYVHVDRQARGADGPLGGVTMAVKDNLPVAGMPWTDGSAVWRDRIADYDTVPVARARAAGVAILGKTNLPELAAAVGTSSTSKWPGRTGMATGAADGAGAATGAIFGRCMLGLLLVFFFFFDA